MPQRGPTPGGTGQRLERVFVLRLWSEHGSQRGSLRGSVVEIKTGQRFFFTQLADLKDFWRCTPANRIAHSSGRNTE